MFKLIWVPKKYKGYSCTKIIEECEAILKECRAREIANNQIYADLMILQNRMANLTEKEARKNLSILIPWLESQFPTLRGEEND